MKCKECDKKIGKVNKTGLCLPCFNVTQRVLPDVFCKVCDKQLNRKKPPKNGLCLKHGLQERNSNPEFIKKVKAGVKKSYESNPELRKSRSKIGKKYGFGGDNKDSFRKVMEDKGSWRRLEDISDWELYREKVRTVSDENYQKHFYDIPNAKKRSREWHLDHRVSIAYGFENDVDVEVISHWKNLEVIHHSVNESKFVDCSITLDKLVEEISG
jgi:hypothetical protein